jgi:hypothetical protein
VPGSQREIFLELGVWRLGFFRAGSFTLFCIDVFLRHGDNWQRWIL